MRKDTQLEPLTVTVKETCRLSGFGVTKVYEFINDGRLTRRKIDGRTLIVFESLKKLLGVSND